MFGASWDTIFAHHIPTQTMLSSIKTNIDAEVRLLVSLVEEPILLNERNLKAILEKVN